MMLRSVELSARRRSSRRARSVRSIANRGCPTGPSSRNRAKPPGVVSRRSQSWSTTRPQRCSPLRSVGPDARTRCRAAGATSRRRKRSPSPCRARTDPNCPNTIATSGSSRARPAERRSVRSSARSINLGTSVSSASANPGSRSTSSGNSRSSERQKASMVPIAISPIRSRSSRHRARSACDCSPATRSS